MEITVKLFSGLKDYLPPDADDHTFSVSTDTPVTPHMLIDRCKLPRAEAQVVMVNDEHLSVEKRDVPLCDGDVMSVWPSIQGG